MKNKCKFVGIMFLCILIVCTLAVMAYEHTAGMKGAAGGVSNSSGNTKNTDEADDILTVVTSFYPMYIAALNIVDGVEGVRLENLSEPQTGCLHDFQLTPEDMKLLSTADVFVINGGGIESFMSDVAKAYPKLDVVEACEDVVLLSEDDADSLMWLRPVRMWHFFLRMMQTVTTTMITTQTQNRTVTTTMTTKQTQNQIARMTMTTVMRMPMHG